MSNAAVGVISSALLLVSGCNAGFDNFQTGTRLGLTRVYRPKEQRSALVFLFSDASGWNESLDHAAAALVSRGAVVVGVPLPAYLSRLATSDDGCHYLISEIEYLSKKVQRDLGFEIYRSPIVAGVGEGATLAYAALAQTPAATIAAAVSIDPTAVLRTRVGLCEGAHAIAEPGGGFRYDAYSKLPGQWRVSALTAANAWQGVAAACGDAARFVPTEGPFETRLISLVEDLLPSGASEASDRRSSLPLIEYPAAGNADTLLVFYSGDGGWRDLDKQIGEIVVRRGVAVVGVDCLRYFWRAKTPAQMAEDLAVIFRTYGERWGTTRLALAGYSFGADIIPFAYNRLPADVRAAVVQVSLLGVESTALFEFKLEGWFMNVAGQRVLPELRQLPPEIVQCFYGEEEEDTLCRSADLAGLEAISTTGSHHFDGDYAALAEHMLDGLERRRAARPLSAR